MLRQTGGATVQSVVGQTGSFKPTMTERAATGSITEGSNDSSQARGDTLKDS